tara:strand:- start:1066 stop:1536 length:471 start_codon:yes stop_codon:yes gene_type:complete
MIGTKHLIQCHCVLPQYRKLEEPIFHQFVVYSKILENGSVDKKIVKCNNCDAVHRIIDLCKSEIVLKLESTDIVIDEDEIKLSLPDKIVKILEKNNCDISTYESIDHILEKSAWGEEVVISRKNIENKSRHFKILQINGKDKFKIKSEILDVWVDL